MACLVERNLWREGVRTEETAVRRRGDQGDRWRGRQGQSMVTSVNRIGWKGGRKARVAGRREEEGEQQQVYRG